MWRLQRVVTFSALRYLDPVRRISKPNFGGRITMNLTFTRRAFAARFASVLSGLGFTAALLPNRALAQGSATPDTGGIRKLNSEGKPGGEKDIIMPVIVHNGLIYVAGQGAHDTRDSKEWTIESHTNMVMEKRK